MNTDDVDHEHDDYWGESATHPIELRCITLAALLLVVDMATITR
jgi:hypothetical protein